jgi:hypothetical protein
MESSRLLVCGVRWSDFGVTSPTTGFPADGQPWARCVAYAADLPPGGLAFCRPSFLPEVLNQGQMALRAHQHGQQNPAIVRRGGDHVCDALVELETWCG